MRIFLLPQVFRLTRNERLPTIALRLAAQQVVAGTLGAGEADLGGGLFKKRIARLGGGKRGGYRFHRLPIADDGESGVRLRLCQTFGRDANAKWTRGAGTCRREVSDGE